MLEYILLFIIFLLAVALIKKNFSKDITKRRLWVLFELSKRFRSEKTINHIILESLELIVDSLPNFKFGSVAIWDDKKNVKIFKMYHSMFGKLDYVTLSEELVQKICLESDDYIKLTKSEDFLLDSDLVKSKNLHIMKLTDGDGAFIFGSDSKSINNSEFEFLRVLVDHFSHGLQTMRLMKKIDRFAKAIDVLEYTYQRIVDHLPVGVVGVDTNKKIVLWNNLMSEMFDLNEDDSIEYPVQNIFLTKKNKRFIEEFIDETCELHDVHAYDGLHYVNKNGIKKVFWVLGYPLKGDGIGINGTILVFRDVTKNYLLEKELKDSQIIKEKEMAKKISLATGGLQSANLELKRLNSLKSEFVSIVSHELRTPLTSIRGYASLLLTGRMGSLSDRQKECLDIMNSEGERLSQLINDLLDLSKLEAGKTTLKIESTDLSKVAKDVITSLKVQSGPKNIQINLKGKRSLEIPADKQKIKQVLYNLAGNAIKFTPDGGSVDIVISEEKTEAVISITDTGIGISKKDIKQLFEPFVQAEDHLQRNVQGSGLGLTISKQIIELHKGSIKVESKLNHGSTFIIRLPKEREE